MGQKILVGCMNASQGFCKGRKWTREQWIENGWACAPIYEELEDPPVVEETIEEEVAEVVNGQTIVKVVETIRQVRRYNDGRVATVAERKVCNESRWRVVDFSLGREEEAQHQHVGRR